MILDGPLLFIGFSAYFLKGCTKKVFKIYKSISFETFKPVPPFPFKVFAKLN